MLAVVWCGVLLFCLMLIVFCELVCFIGLFGCVVVCVLLYCFCVLRVVSFSLFGLDVFAFVFWGLCCYCVCGL